MSRSRKHLPIAGIAGATDKLAKRWWNRDFRRRTRRRLDRAQEFDTLVLPEKMQKETEYWDGSKETKCWWPDWPKVCRK